MPGPSEGVALSIRVRHHGCVTRYFYDTEFIEDGRTIDLVSIGIVSESGAEYFAISTDFDRSKAIPWVRDNVLAQLPPVTDERWKPRSRIRDEVLAFLTQETKAPELWAWYGAYDHVALCQLFGSMPALPRALPRFTRELRQLWEMLGEPRLPVQTSARHDSLEDARQAQKVYAYLVEHGRKHGLRPL
jgi:3' exoribonuclease, RNase T-like